MLCPTCSTEAPAGSTFCPKCGHPLDGAVAKAKVASPPSPAVRVAAGPAEQLKAAQAAAGGVTPEEPERELGHGGYSPKAMYGSWLLAILVTVAAAVACIILPLPMVWIAAPIVAIVLWLCLLVSYAALRLGVDYTLTTQRFIHKSGLLTRVMNRIAVIDIDDVAYEQRFMERMFGVGTIKLLSSDVSDPQRVHRGIDDVQRVATMIDDARREERRKRAIYMETV